MDSSTASKKQKMTKKILVLFDVDGTLTEPRAETTLEMKTFLDDLKNVVTVGIIGITINATDTWYLCNYEMPGGSDLIKQQEQMGSNIVNEVDYSFSENGLVAYKDGVLIGKKAINDELGIFIN